MAFETTIGSYTLSDAPERFNVGRGHDWIAGQSYWGAGIPLARFEASVRGSLTVGVYATSDEMAAMARVVTDRATFAWICDVFVDEAYRGQGLGKAIMAYLTEHPDLQGLRRLHLATRDAHSLYAQFGFQPLTGVDRWMEIRNRHVYPAAAAG